MDGDFETPFLKVHAPDFLSLFLGQKASASSADASIPGAFLRMPRRCAQLQ
jgi:hypothetical protein